MRSTEVSQDFFVIGRSKRKEWSLLISRGGYVTAGNSAFGQIAERLVSKSRVYETAQVPREF